MIEEIYKNFTTNLLPKIQEGLMITKDYFTDLFGRYVHYLIIMDSIWIVVGIILLIIGIISTKEIIKIIDKIEEENKNKRYFDKEDTGQQLILFALTIIMGIVGIIIIGTSTKDLIKDIYIPEVRVLEEINNYLK